MPDPLRQLFADQQAGRFAAAEAGYRALLAADPSRPEVWHGFAMLAFAQGRAEVALAVLEQALRHHPDDFECLERRAAVSGHADHVAAFVALRDQRATNLQPPPGRRTVLMVGHRWGGGIDRHIQDLSALLSAESFHVLVLRPDYHVAGRVWLDAPDGRSPLGLWSGDDPGAVIAGLNIAVVHVHNLAGYADQMIDWLGTAQRQGARLVVTAHDYAAFCPRLHLIDASGRYCGEPDASHCRACIADNGSPFGAIDLDSWRARYARLLGSADKVYAPSADAAARLTRHLPGQTIAPRPHPDRWLDVRTTRSPLQPGPRRVAVIGHLFDYKGRDIVAACAREAMVRDLALRFVILGQIDDAAQFADLATVEPRGPYAEDAALDAIRAAACDCAFFASVWPETYSYTLSIAWAAGLTAIAFDFGAISERVRAAGGGHLLPLDLMTNPAAINDALLSLPSLAPPRVEPPKPTSWSAYYYG